MKLFTAIKISFVATLLSGVIFQPFSLAVESQQELSSSENRPPLASRLWALAGDEDWENQGGSEKDSDKQPVTSLLYLLRMGMGSGRSPASPSFTGAVQETFYVLGMDVAFPVVEEEKFEVALGLRSGIKYPRTVKLLNGQPSFHFALTPEVIGHMDILDTNALEISLNSALQARYQVVEYPEGNVQSLAPALELEAESVFPTMLVARKYEPVLRLSGGFWGPGAKFWGRADNETDLRTRGILEGVVTRKQFRKKGEWSGWNAAASMGFTWSIGEEETWVQALLGWERTEQKFKNLLEEESLLNGRQALYDGEVQQNSFFLAMSRTL